MQDIPKVLLDSNQEKESFDDYMAKWPIQLDYIPADVIREWIYRHSPIVGHVWGDYLRQDLMFNLAEYRIEELLKISRYDLDGSIVEGKHLVQAVLDGGTGEYVADFMCKEGEFPTPIIVAIDAGSVSHPVDPGKMKSPCHLIEGHTRLKIFWGMYELAVPMKKVQKVWEVRFPPGYQGPVFPD